MRVPVPQYERWIPSPLSSRYDRATGVSTMSLAIIIGGVGGFVVAALIDTLWVMPKSRKHAPSWH